MKTIAIFSAYYLEHLGGIERYTYELAKKLTELGNRVIIVTSNYANEKTFEEKEEATIYRLPILRIFSNRYPLIKYNKRENDIIKELKKQKIDQIILNTRFYITTLIGAKFANKEKIPCFLIEHVSSHFTVHNKILDYLGHFYEHKITDIVKKRVKDFYGVSQVSNNWLQHFEIKAKGIIPSSIDIKEYEKYKEKYYETHSEKTIILYAGRIIKEKGIILLAEAYTRLKKEKIEAELFVAGEGKLLKKLKRKYPEINFLGVLKYDVLMSLYNKADILVNPSICIEGCPMVIIEAGLMKTCVITSNKGGSVEIIQNEKNGITCEDNVTSIYESLKKVINNKKCIEKYGEQLRKDILEKHTWKEIENYI